MTVRARLPWRALTVAGGAGALAVLGWFGFTPIDRGQVNTAREEIFEIPQGTWARRMSGDKVGILPDEIRLTLGIRDILVLKNQDDVPQIFGPTLMMPGQSFRLPFAQASEYQFACTAHASGQMTVIVEPYPATPWARVNWRVRELIREVG
jgi:hypothetical protein